MDSRSAQTGIASSGAWKSCDPEMITRRELGGSNNLRLGICGVQGQSEPVGGWCVVSVDVGARSFAECQPAALAPGPGYYASLCRLEMASKVIIQRRRAGVPSRPLRAGQCAISNH